METYKESDFRDNTVPYKRSNQNLGRLAKESVVSEEKETEKEKIKAETDTKAEEKRRGIMSEQDKMTEQETEVTTSGEAPQEKKKQEVPTRSMILMILAGCYLVYTGYRLCKNVLDGVEGGSWGFFAAGAAFIVVGAVMLFVGGRNYLRREKEKRAERRHRHRSSGKHSRQKKRKP